MTKQRKILLTIVLSIFVVLVGLFFYLRQDSKPQQEIAVKERQELSILSGMVYRHLIGYSLVCQKANQPLKKYPDIFGKKYKQDIQKIDTLWQKFNTSLHHTLIKFDDKVYPLIEDDIKSELLDLERYVVILLQSKEKNIPMTDVVWTDEFEKKLDLKDACLLLDDMSDFFLENSSFDQEFKRRINELSNK